MLVLQFDETVQNVDYIIKYNSKKQRLSAAESEEQQEETLSLNPVFLNMLDLLFWYWTFND